ncbi:MAG: phosphopantetheine-binding protein, partial [Cyanobacteriota bacterium]|nr:phosphopantetheine-binding protein [Cyanobacteriota bacterium]
TELRVVPMSHNTMNSNGAGMQPPTTPAHPQGTAEVALAAYQAYQETMRQFLGLQEQVMKQFLGGISSGAPAPTLPPAPPLRTPLPPAGNGLSPSHPDARSYAVPQTETAMSPSPAALSPLPDLANGSAAPISPLPEPVAAASAPAPPPPAKPETAAIDRDALTQILLQLVSDRTGYPVEMLGLEQDIEAELGIDSIKRVEILGSLPKTLPEPLATNIQSKMEELTRVKSLKNLVEQLMALASLQREEQRLGKS